MYSRMEIEGDYFPLLEIFLFNPRSNCAFNNASSIDGGADKVYEISADWIIQCEAEYIRDCMQTILV